MFEYFHKNVPQPHLGITKRDNNLIPAELLSAHVLRPLLCPDPHQLPLVLIQEIGLFWIIRQPKPHRHRHHDRKQALNDIHPPPASVATCPVHLENQVGQQAAKGARKRRAHKQVRHAARLLLALVNHGEV
jgi:hypothetical protein